MGTAGLKRLELSNGVVGTWAFDAFGAVEVLEKRC
jgi:hypothetical protein